MTGRRIGPSLTLRFVSSHVLVALAATAAVYLVVRLTAPALFDQELRRGTRQGQGTGRAPGSGTAQLVHDQFQNALTNAVLIGALAGALIAVLLGIFAARRLVRPINQVRAATREIARGNYRVHVPEPKAAELAELAADVGQLGHSLADTEARRTRLLGEVAHEMRTPLTVIDGYLEAMTDGVMPATQTEFAQLQAEVRRLTRLSDDLSALSRAEEGRVELKPADVDLAQIAQRAAERLRAQAEDAGLTLRVTSSGPLPVSADADRMAQVVTNLVGNAIRATPAGGEITVASSTQKANALVQVSDTGEGIAADDLDKVFERFYRVPGRRRSPSETGSGIGLTISRSLVERQGGTLTAASQGQGRGATFTIALPLR